MTIRVPLWLIIGIASLATMAGGLWWVRYHDVMAEGGQAASPDGQYYVDLQSIATHRPFCPRRAYYSFGVYQGHPSPGKRLFREIQIPVDRESDLKIVHGSPPFDVLWSPDGKTVSCKIDDVSITVQVLP